MMEVLAVVKVNHFICKFCSRHFTKEVSKWKKTKTPEEN